MSKLQWNQLLCEERIRKSSSVRTTEKEDMFVNRNQFEAEYDSRIILSAEITGQGTSVSTAEE